MKKINILFLCVIIMVSLVACNANGNDKNNEVTITVIEYLPSALNVRNESLYYRDNYSKNVLKIKKDSEFSKDVFVKYLKSQNKLFGGFGSGEFIGFFTDQDLSFKYDEEQTVDKDITLYFERYSRESANQNYCMFTFEYENKTYRVAKKFSDLVTVDIFKNGAYGKYINNEELRFYFDSEYTDEVLFDNKTVLDYYYKMKRDGTYFAEIKIYVVNII